MLTLPAYIEIKIRNKLYKLNIADLPLNILREATILGLQATLRNSAISAPNEDITRQLLNNRLSKLKAGTWHDRSKG